MRTMDPGWNDELEEMKIQPVGDGLIDLICAPENIDRFVDLCNEMGVTIQGFTWWCHVTEGHEPCGMGGPVSKYFDGWFSEVPMEDIIKIEGNEGYREYLREKWPKDPDFHECYWPGFWIEA